MKKSCPCNLLQNPYCIDIKHFSLDLLLILSIHSSCTGGRNRTGLSAAGGSGRQATSLLHPHIKTHRAREVARWGDPLRSGLLPFAWAIGTGRFCAHAATCRSAYAGLPCGRGLGNTDRSDFHRLIRKVSAAFSASVFPCQFWKMKPRPASMEYASKAAQAGFDPAPSVLRAHPAPYKSRPAFTHDNCCLSAENSGRAATFSLFCGASHCILRIPCCTRRRARTAAT